MQEAEMNICITCMLVQKKEDSCVSKCHMYFSGEEKGFLVVCFIVMLQTWGASAENNPFIRTATLLFVLKDVSKPLLQKALCGLTDISESLVLKWKEKIKLPHQAKLSRRNSFLWLNYVMIVYFEFVLPSAFSEGAQGRSQITKWVSERRESEQHWLICAQAFKGQ